MSAQSDILVRSDADRGLFLTVAISAAVHLGVLAFIAFVPSRLFERPRVESYTVDLIAPSAIGGTNVRPGAGRAKPAVKLPARSEPLGPPEPPAAKVEKIEPAPAPKVPDPPIPSAPKVEAKPAPPPAPKPVEVAPEPPKPQPKPEVVASKPAPKPPPKVAPVAKAEPAPKPPPPVAKVPAKVQPAVDPPAAAPAKPVARSVADPNQERDRRIAEAIGQRAKQVEKAPPKAPDPIDSRIEAAVQRRAAQVGEGAANGSGGPVSYGPATGAGGVVQGVEYILYRNQMESRIKAAWAWAGANRSLKAVVQFNILPTGEIVNIRVTGPSGDSAYDTSVERALRAVSPLDPPPERYREDFSVVELEFRPEDLES